MIGSNLLEPGKVQTKRSKKDQENLAMENVSCKKIVDD